MTAPDWIWYGRDSDGKSQVSFGRWQAHKCQLRYKLAAIQPTEHDHTHVPLAEAMAVPEAIYALSWAKAALAEREVDAPPVERALAALRAIGGRTNA